MKEKSDNQNTPDPILRSLEIFKGEWKIKGKYFSSEPEGGEQKVKGKVQYQWLKGKFFLVSMWNKKHGNESHVGTEITGFDKEKNSITADSFNNSGSHKNYSIHSADGITWRFTGDTERAFISFAADFKSFVEYRETASGNNEWKPLCRLKAKKR